MNNPDNSDQSAVEHKLTVARTRLILDKPFLGALVLRLPLVDASNWCATSGTDAKSIYYNRSYIADLNLSQVQFVLAHEALHCGLSHFARREHRDRIRWDVACDYAVNQLLLEDDLEQPHGTLFKEEYAGMSAEEIYPCIDPDDEEHPMDQHLYYPDLNDTSSNPDPLANNPDQEGGSGEQSPGDILQNRNSSSAPAPENEPPVSPGRQERERLDTQWQQRLASAAQQAAQAGKLTESMNRILERLLQPPLPWRALLSRFMSSATRTDYNLSRPSRRREGDAILPSLHTRYVNVAVALDTSGSVQQTELSEFLNELDAIKGSINARVTLLACDEKLNHDCPWVYEPYDQMKLPEHIEGGGLTDFAPVFDWLAEQISQPDLLVYFTDARGRFPDVRPHLPVLWLVKGSAGVPWGQRIQLN